MQMNQTTESDMQMNFYIYIVQTRKMSMYVIPIKTNAELNDKTKFKLNVK